LEDIRVSWAFLVAAQGITGSNTRSTHAHWVIQKARGRKINLLVLTRADLESLQSPTDFENIVRNKIMAHILGSPSF
jgi:hypothetical protein